MRPCVTLFSALLLACEPTVATVGNGFDGENPTTSSLELVGGVEDTQDPETDTQEPKEPGVDFYVLDRVHELSLTIPTDSWSALQRDPREYALATLHTEDGEYEIGVRLKGGSTYRQLNDKPSLKLKFDWAVDEQRIWDLQGINLHNQTYDPSMMAEALAYYAYRSFGVSAPRTAFVNLGVNGRATVSTGRSSARTRRGSRHGTRATMGRCTRPVRSTTPVTSTTVAVPAERSVTAGRSTSWGPKIPARI
jgi:hypothetical protein